MTHLLSKTLPPIFIVQLMLMALILALAAPVLPDPQQPPPDTIIQTNNPIKTNQIQLLCKNSMTVLPFESRP